ncbi:TPA: M48 family metallopeptidase [Providencia alcalifaciens]|uniref:M48 family metalloprotease n=3 Tax=Providencia alcalifaciens TaxID=126385 RepID=A0AAW9VA47_9GAMM|nr:MULTISPECIES: M48 family metallopeptidase [Providencia]ATG15712.1 metalloprotease [Providencia alcalifaciens]EEB44272.1 peptidase, M48 family [Providencia alcalifaciens DSM 30120]ETT07671.1 metalloprotease YggG [Providencia alcalifaciens F90-2004]EUC95031.1 metalloprotease YggG [Providencia alcalifaciens PAL-2]EUD04769.1 metalloprotease YggG [Providencia alcalifaciens RIMD 1656011]
MKMKALVAVAVSAVIMTGCKSMDTGLMTNSGMQLFQAATLSDADVKKFSDDACKEMDAENKIAPASSKYTQRLNKIAKALGSEVEGTPVNYKVYMTKDVNAWAMANGCVRVYSGLMDIMNDNEVEGVLGHEMGHVALGHTRKAMQVAYAAVAARTAVAASGNDVATQLSSSQLGELGQKLVNSQFSQHQESQADDFSYDLLKKRGVDTKGLVTGFDKLAKLGSKETSMFDSHPPSDARAQHIRDRIEADKK